MEKTLLERCRQYVECVVKYDPTETEERLLADLDAAIAQQAEPVAHVPVHPRNGPLWAMTTATPDPERLPGHYPLMPLYAAPQPPSAKPLMSDMDAVVALCKKGPADAYPAIQPVDERAEPVDDKFGGPYEALSYARRKVREEMQWAYDTLAASQPPATSGMPEMPDPDGRIDYELWGQNAQADGVFIKTLQKDRAACYAAGRRQGLEEAAKVCRGNVCENGAPAWVDACTSCSHDILALKDKA